MNIQRPHLHVKARCPTCRVCSHRAATHLPAGIEGVRTHASISLLRVSAGVLCLASNDGWCCTMCALKA